MTNVTKLQAAAAMSVLIRAMKYHDEWLVLSKKYPSHKGEALRNSLKAKVKALIAHDRILTGRGL